MEWFNKLYITCILLAMYSPSKTKLTDDVLFAHSTYFKLCSNTPAVWSILKMEDRHLENLSP